MEKLTNELIDGEKLVFDSIVDVLEKKYISQLIGTGKTTEEMIDLAVDIYIAKSIAASLKEIIVDPDTTDTEVIETYYHSMVKAEIEQGMPAYDEDYMFDIYNDFYLQYEDDKLDEYV